VYEAATQSSFAQTLQEAAFDARGRPVTLLVALQLRQGSHGTHGPLAADGPQCRTLDRRVIRHGQGCERAVRVGTLQGDVLALADDLETSVCSARRIRAFGAFTGNLGMSHARFGDGGFQNHP